MSAPEVLELPSVTFLTDDDGHVSVEPTLDRAWTDAKKLAWFAAAVAHDTGLQLSLTKSGGSYVIGAPGTAISAASFRVAGDILNGIRFGAVAMLASGPGAVCNRHDDTGQRSPVMDALANGTGPTIET